MSDQSQGPGWWVASDGKWYPPEQAPGATPQPEPPVAPTQPVAQPTPEPAPGTPDTPTAPDTPAYEPPTAPMPQTQPAPYAAAPVPPQYPPGPPGAMPPGQYPPGPPGATPPGGEPPKKGHTGLIIGIIVLVVLLLGGGVAFALTRSKDATDTAATTTTAPSTTAAPSTSKKAPGTTEPGTTTTKKSPSTSRLTTTTTGDASTPGTTPGDVAAYCAVVKVLDADDPFAGVDKTNTPAVKAALSAWVERHTLELAQYLQLAPDEIKADVSVIVVTITQSADNPAVLTTQEYKTASDHVNAYDKAHCGA